MSFIWRRLSSCPLIIIDDANASTSRETIGWHWRRWRSLRAWSTYSLWTGCRVIVPAESGRLTIMQTGSLRSKSRGRQALTQLPQLLRRPPGTRRSQRFVAVYLSSILLVKFTTLQENWHFTMRQVELNQHGLYLRRDHRTPIHNNLTVRSRLVMLATCRLSISTTCICL